MPKLTCMWITGCPEDATLISNIKTCLLERYDMKLDIRGPGLKNNFFETHQLWRVDLGGHCATSLKLTGAE